MMTSYDLLTYVGVLICTYKRVVNGVLYYHELGMGMQGLGMHTDTTINA